MATKRYPIKITPPTYEHVFERERLYDIVEQKKTCNTIWVNGPPGAGKTVFITSLLKKQKAKFLWYRIDSSENNLEDIFYFLALAANRNHPWKKLQLPIFSSEYAGNIENFARVFFRQLFESLTKESAIVLDNCQEIEKDPTFFQLLQIAANELPQAMQLICISRNQPDATLKRLRLNNELLEIDDATLRFDPQESHAFLAWLNPQLTDHHIHHIQTKTQGWTAGMVLMAEQFNITGAIDDDDTGAIENISDYLVSEMLSYIPKEHHLFLVASALFTQLTAKMGAELTGNRKAKQYLDALVAKNFLIERAAGSKPSYSYHPLFREMLLNETDTLFTPTQWQKLQHKAALILVAQDRPVEAMTLYQQLQDWASLKNLLLQQAEQLITAGRHLSVSRWAEALPADHLKSDAWLNYWYAVALKPTAPLVAVEHLEVSYQKFVAENDVKGIYSTWQAAVESITVSMDDFSGLKLWMTRFDEMRRQYPSCPSIELKVRVYATAVQAFSFHNPQHPWAKSMVRICEGILRITPIKMVKTVLSAQLAHYYSLTCQVNKLKTIVPTLESSLNDDTLPVIPRIMGAYMLITYCLHSGNVDKGIMCSNMGLELSEKFGIHLFQSMLLGSKIACHIHNGDLINAEKTLQEAIKTKNVQQRSFVTLIDAYIVWLAALKGEKKYALQQIQQTVQLAKLMSVECSYVIALAFEAQISAELRQWDNAQQALALLSIAAKDSNNYFNLIPYYLSDAWLAYLQPDETRTLTAMQQLLTILRTEQIFFFFGWRPEVLVPLCLLAIENGIEEEFTVRLLNKIRPVPKPPLWLEQWPWPVRIYCFGTLSIEIDSKPLEQSGKSQKKIIELLSLIISMGGRHINSDQLGEMLWPDADGDLMNKSIETALHRLRKLIGKEAVLFNAGVVSLNDSYCWLDLWAFEETATELEDILKSDKQDHRVIKLTDRLLKLYPDTFLINSDSGVTILKREQLLNKLCRLIDLTIHYHEQQGENERTSMLLIKSIELRPLLEENYVRLMSHYIALDQPDQGLYIYQQCKQTLCTGFDIQLSNKIQSVAKEIVGSEKPKSDT